ncbi:hypothetical protein [Paenibacillus sp. VMFN-D1]|nr:hypothetical protein [Paenibacillus sp. VMFN-D1]
MIHFDIIVAAIKAARKLIAAGQENKCSVAESKLHSPTIRAII